MLYVEAAEDLALVEEEFIIIDKSWFYDAVVDLELDEMFSSMIEEAEVHGYNYA